MAGLSELLRQSARQTLAASGLAITTADSMSDGARKIVAAVKPA